MAKPIFLGIKFPFEKGPDGIPNTLTNVEIIKNDLFLLLNTRKKERVMLPDFGLDLERFIFENTGPLLRAKIIREVVTAVSTYEPRITIINIDVVEEGQTVTTTLVYQVNGLTDRLDIENQRAA